MNYQESIYFEKSLIQDKLVKQTYGTPSFEENIPFQITPNKIPPQQPSQLLSDLKSLDSQSQIIKLKDNQSRNSSPLVQNHIFTIIKVQNLVKKFINILMQQASVLAHTQNYYYIKERYLQFENQKQYFKESILIIDPTNIIIICLDWLFLGIVLFLLIYNPLIWSFNQLQTQFLKNFSFYSTIFLLGDTFLKLNTAVILKGDIIKQRIEILQIVFPQIILDILFFFNILILFTYQELIFITTFCVLGFTKFYKQFEKLLNLFDLSLSMREIVSLIKLLLIIILSGHIIACFWHYIGMTTMDHYDNSWILQKDLLNQSQETQYMFSYYWAIATMVTVGYGDITPENVIEALSCTLIMFVSCGVFAFSLNKVGQIIQNLNDQDGELNEIIRSLTQYMKQHKIPVQLQGRIRNYLQYTISEKNQKSKINNQEIIQNLSSDLKQELMYNVFTNLTNNCQLFSKNFKLSTIKKLSQLLEPRLYSPGDTLFIQNEIDDCSIFFVDYGQVDLIEQQSGTIVSTFSKGQFFGEKCFFTQEPRSFSAKSNTFTKVYSIKRNTFIEILSTEELEQFHEIKCSFQHSYFIEGYKCNICQAKSHDISKCNYLKYVPNLERLILQNNFLFQKRKEYFRKNRKYKCLQHLETITRQQSELEQELDDNEKHEATTIQDNSSHITDQRASIEEEELKKRSSPSTVNLIFQRKSSSLKNESQKMIEKEQQLKIPIQKNSATIINHDQDNMQNSKNLTTTLLDFQNSLQINKQNSLQINKQNSKQNNNLIIARSRRDLRVTYFEHFTKQIDDFDKMKIFDNYFTHNNYNNIIDAYNKFVKQYKKYVKINTKYSLIQKFIEIKKPTFVSKRRMIQSIKI